MDLQAVIAKARPEVRDAYGLMRRPPQYELFDLENDPFEFRNLADGPASTEVLHELRKELTQWRPDTGDAPLDPETLEQLTRGEQAVQER